MDPILERYHALEKKVAAYTPNLDTQRLYDALPLPTPSITAS